MSYTLLSLLNDGTKIFANALKHESAETGKTKSTEEQLSNEIMRTFDIVTKHIKSYQIHLDNKKNYTEVTLTMLSASRSCSAVRWM